MADKSENVGVSQVPPAVDSTSRFGAREANGIVRCDACPVLCRIRPGKSGACDRYCNNDGNLERVDPLVLVEKSIEHGDNLVPFEDGDKEWDGNPINRGTFVTAIGSGTTYPDYKPAPFIVATEHHGVDTVTVVSEGIFSYCGVKIKIDTDKHLGSECAAVRCNGEQVGHVTTGEYGSQMLSLGGVNHLTGGSKKEGRVTCETLLTLCNGGAVELTVDEGSTVVVEAGKAPIIDGTPERRMRVGCGSATIGIFAQQWHGHVDEVVVVDEHITGVLSEHQAGKCLNIPPSGIRVVGRRSTPGRYFNVANPGLGWGGTDIIEPLSIIKKIDENVAVPGNTLLLTTTTGEESSFYKINDDFHLIETEMPAAVRKVVDRIGENCEPSLCSVVFVGGAGGSLRAGVTENPVKLTDSVKQGSIRVSMGGSPVYRWPGGGITIMVDVTSMPKNSFGYVPTPAIVAPIEFTLPKDLYGQLGGHMDHVVTLEQVIEQYGDTARRDDWRPDNPWPLDRLENGRNRK